MLPNELLWIFEIHISGNNVYRICKQEAILWAGWNWDRGCPGGQDGYYHCPVSLYCHPENRVKCLWTKLNSVVTFFPRINQLIKMDTAHWKDLSVLIFLRFLSGWEKCWLVKVRGFPLKSGSCWCTKLSLNSSPYMFRMITWASC